MGTVIVLARRRAWLQMKQAIKGVTIAQPTFEQPKPEGPTSDAALALGYLFHGVGQGAGNP